MEIQPSNASYAVETAATRQNGAQAVDPGKTGRQVTASRQLGLSKVFNEFIT